jgi:asparagine synthetase B (glutamine-hydrolysing)
MPGECLVIDTDSGSVKSQVAGIYPKNIQQDIDRNTAAETFHSLFVEGLNSRIRSLSHNEKLLIPISGGLDSRYILGAALEIVDATRIVTMSFGAPGSFDFEIGRKVAKAAGVKHVAYPLDPGHFSNEALRSNCMDTQGQISFTTEAPFEIYKDFRRYGKINLSGYVGDAIMGNKYHRNGTNSRASIVIDDSHVKPDNPLTRHLSPELIKDSFYFENGNPSPLKLDEHWFFINHFTKYSNYCVFKNRKEFTYINPFVDYAFVNFVSNLPGHMREQRCIYFDWLIRKYPDLASLPCKLYRGAPLNASKTKRFVSLQWDRINHYIFGNRRTANKIDLYRHRRELLDMDRLKKTAAFLPKEFKEILFRNTSYYLIWYNLRCLDILKTEFGVHLANK